MPNSKFPAVKLMWLLNNTQAKNNTLILMNQAGQKVVERLVNEINNENEVIK